MSASHPSPCKTCDGSGEVETGQTTSARCYNCKGTGVHPSEAEGRTPMCPHCSRPLQRVRYPGGYLNEEQFDAIRLGDWFCENCPRYAHRYRYFWDTSGRVEIPAAPSDEPAIMRGVTVRGGRVEVPTGFTIENCSFLDGAAVFEIIGDGEPIQYRGPAIPPSVEARDATLPVFGMPLDENHPLALEAGEPRIIEHSFGIASLLPPETP